ncbi:MAG: hypothetical protein HOH14_06195 [Gammaproteobacteria bacterium]|jgi:hypothetical protein|nr:hypothetical protein [Gammaproteobacteria bacterium]MBT6043064.1 hypothetical protein [Gammaproteobacteria bacterium]
MKQNNYLNVFSSILALLLLCSGPSFAQDEEYQITVMPPGSATPRLPSGKPDFTGMWLPNSAGQGVSGRFGVDPAARRQFDPEVTPEARPQFLPAAIEHMEGMSEIELELSKSSVNCMPRGVPAIWLQNPYGTMLTHKDEVFVQLYEVLNNFRVIYTDGRPLMEYPEPLFHGNSTAHWEDDTLVVESTLFDERTFILPNGWYHSDELKVTERYSRPSENYLVVEITVEDPQVLAEPWHSAPRRWSLTQAPINEYYCTNNQELEELELLREQLESGE